MTAETLRPPFCALRLRSRHRRALPAAATRAPAGLTLTTASTMVGQLPKRKIGGLEVSCMGLGLMGRCRALQPETRYCR